MLSTSQNHPLFEISGHSSGHINTATEGLTPVTNNQLMNSAENIYIIITVSQSRRLQAQIHRNKIFGRDTEIREQAICRFVNCQKNTVSLVPNFF